LHTRNLVLTTQFGRNKGAGIFPGLFLLLLSGSSSLFIIWCFFRFCCDPTIFFIPYYAFVRYYYHYHFMILGCFVSLKEQLLIFSSTKHSVSPSDQFIIICVFTNSYKEKRKVVGWKMKVAFKLLRLTVVKEYGLILES